MRAMRATVGPTSDAVLAAALAAGALLCAADMTATFAINAARNTWRSMSTLLKVEKRYAGACGRVKQVNVSALSEQRVTGAIMI
jgi:hypothetical protein